MVQAGRNVVKVSARVRALVSVVVVLVAIAAAGDGSALAAGPNQYGPPSWFPLRHNANGGAFKVSCVVSNPGCGSYHGYWAIDFSDPAAKPGAPVFAAGAGQVSAAVASNSACGGSGTPSNYVNINHGSGVVTRYLHLNTVTVGNGQWVDQNTQIGTVGSVGYTVPCPAYHLHFQVLVNGNAADPGPLTACHGSSVVSYPGAIGYASWNQVPYLGAQVYSGSWEDQGGSLSGGVTTASWAPNRLDVFAVASNGRMVHKWWDGQRWSDWEDQGGALAPEATVVSWAPNRLDVFARTSDARLVHKWWAGNGWSN